MNDRLRDDGERFAFGKNWRSFLQRLDQTRIDEASRSLTTLLGTDDLSGRTFLDIGSGSGLSSLVAHRLGADVVSFDYDIDSVVCTRSLQERFGGEGRVWRVLRGSALDASFMAGLGTFDVTYSWGVLHHTGDMATGIALSAERVRPGGILALAIYNEQGWRSRLWWHIKRFYCRGQLPQMIVEAIFFPVFFAYNLAHDVSQGRWPGTFLDRYVSQRGMSIFHDWRDWLGGFPFETSTPAAMIDRLSELGFALVRMRTTHGLGCNEFVFLKSPDRDDPGSRTNSPPRTPT
jgi:2-polyprenyl-3-methyl-5-hydroxy-6-metoxy-1,4-benzoquinol methylase